MKEIGNLLTNSNIVGETFNLNMLNITVIHHLELENKNFVHISIDENPAREWIINIPKDIGFIKTIQCNIATQDITKEEFQCYRKMLQVAYALSVYFIDVKNNLEKEVLSDTAFAGYEFYEYAEELLKQIHAEIEKREKAASMKSKL